MSSKVIVLLLIVLSFRGGDALLSGVENRKHIARLNDQDPLVGECISLTTDDNHSLQKIIRAIVNGEWHRVQLVLQLASESCTAEMRRGVYEALWLEWQQDKHIYNPLKILDFYKQLENESNVPKTLMEKIYQAFIARFAQLLSAPFHTDSRTSDFPQVTKLLSQLKESPQKYTRDIFETLFDDVLSLESSLSVAQRLGNFNASLEQLAMANLQFLNRSEVLVNSNVHAVLLDNLRQLMKQPNFHHEVERFILHEVYKLLPSKMYLLFIAQKVCLRKADNDKEYIYECSGSSNMCTNQRYEEQASLTVQHQISNVDNKTQFAFYNRYWNNHYLGIEDSLRGQPGVTKNVGGRVEIYWLNVVPVEKGVAIYDAATSRSVICGGDPAQWNKWYHYAYTRRAEDFDEHRKDCTWVIEDCSK